MAIRDLESVRVGTFLFPDPNGPNRRRSFRGKEETGSRVGPEEVRPG